MKILISGKRNTGVDNKIFNFEKSIKNLANIDEKINMIIDYYKPKTKTKYDDKKELLVFLMKLESLCLIFIVTMKLF